MTDSPYVYLCTPLYPVLLYWECHGGVGDYEKRTEGGNGGEEAGFH
jgi:hypothetical protein